MKSHEKVEMELKENNFIILSRYQGSKIKIPIQCTICGFNFVKLPKREIKCTVCSSEIRTCERWTANLLRELKKKSDLQFIVTWEKRAKIKIIGEKVFVVKWDFIIYDCKDIYLRHPILIIEVMEEAHFFFPNDREDNQAIDNKDTFKFRRSDYNKWMGAFQLLVPTLFINEHDHINKNNVYSIKQGIKKAFEISKIKNKKTKKEEIIRYFQFPAPRLIPFPDYNQKKLGFFPWEALAICNNYNLEQPINWDMFQESFQKSCEGIYQ